MKTLWSRRCWMSMVGAVMLVANGGLAAAPFENNLEKAFPVSPGGKFVLDADQGSCEINAVESDKAQIRVLREVKGGTKAEADEQFANHEVTFEQNGGTITVIAKKKKTSGISFRNNRVYLQVRYVVSIPKKFDLDLKTAGGDVTIPDMDGLVKARTTSGGIRVERASGAIEAGNAGGNITIGEAGADLTAHTTSGSINVQGVNGKAELSDAGGDIHVVSAGKGVVAKTTSGSIHLKSVKGDVEANNAGGNIVIELAGGDVAASTTSGSIKLGQIKGKSVNLKNAGGDIGVESADGAVVARTSSGTLKFKIVKGALEARDAGGDIIIGEAGKSVAAETTSGSIRIESTAGPVEAKDAGGNISIGSAGDRVTARTTSGSIVIKSAKGKVSATNSGGDIEVKGAQSAIIASTTSGGIVAEFAGQPTDDSRLEVSGGGITLAVPRSAGFDLDATSAGGSVRTELPIQSTIQAAHRGGKLQGKLNKGGPALLLRCSSGDIQINGSNVAASAAPGVKVEDDEKQSK